MSEETKQPSEIQDLRKILFESMDKLNNGEMDIEKAKAMTGLAQAVIGTAKVEVEFIKAVGGIATGTGFIPLEPKKPGKLGEGEKEGEK